MPRFLVNIPVVAFATVIIEAATAAEAEQRAKERPSLWGLHSPEPEFGGQIKVDRIALDPQCLQEDV